MTPRGAEGPLPLLTLVHGGPTWNWGAFFSDSEPNAVLLASAGYACLLPNPRGSIGRGHAFAQAVIGDSGGMDFQDVMAGVDACIAMGVADPERLGISGLSYGGYMAGWAVTQTDRFKAAVAMSVVSNYVSFHLTSEVWMYDEMILEGEWNDPTSQYVERSPVTHAHRCRTPTLVIQGAEDRCTPVGQGWELANAIAASRHRGRARRLPARGPRPDGARARARRDPADAGLVRPAPALGRLTIGTSKGAPRRAPLGRIVAALDPGDAEQQQLSSFALVREVRVGVGVDEGVRTRRLLDPERVRLDVDQERARPERRGGVDDAGRLPRAPVAVDGAVGGGADVGRPRRRPTGRSSRRPRANPRTGRTTAAPSSRSEAP